MVMSQARRWTCSKPNRPREISCSATTRWLRQPHLGASTTEAQENVALQVAEQISDYLLTVAITNALNMPSISASEAQKVRPWISLSEKLGSFAGQLTGTSLMGVEIVYEGTPSLLNTRALTQAALAGLLRPILAEVKHGQRTGDRQERGIKVSETRRDAQGIYEGYIKLVVEMSDGTTRRVAGTRLLRRPAAPDPDQGYRPGCRICAATCFTSSTRTSRALSASWAPAGRRQGQYRQLHPGP